MSECVHIITEDSITVINTSNGESLKFYSGDVDFDRVEELVRQGNYKAVFDKDARHVVNNFFEDFDSSYKTQVVIEDGVGKIISGGGDYPLSDAIVKKIILMNEQGFSAKPLIEFLGNLMRNPSSSAVNELYDFIDKCNLPITEDGHFIAYKIVKEDYTDIYTGTISNKIGEAPRMPRNQVDDVRTNTCSKGLHFCSKEYLNCYGTSSRGTDRCMLVKINPADVVSIPVDYNFAKGRAWTYRVVGEVEGEWRTWLGEKDYTEDAVVDGNGDELDNVDFNPIHPNDPEEYAEVDLSNCDYDDTSFDFLEGYSDGYEDGRKKNPFNEASNYENYDAGYILGYKHGKNHRRKMY